MEKTYKELTSGRWPAWQKAIAWIAANKPQVIIETGCYRGIPADGNSTLVLARLAKEHEAHFHSFELNQFNIDKARALLERYDLMRSSWVEFHAGDSAEGIEGALEPGTVGFAYLDSFDYQPHDLIECQLHQLNEVVTLLPLMAERACILLDDYLPGDWGKTGLSSRLLDVCGWRGEILGNQIIYIK